LLGGCSNVDLTTVSDPHALGDLDLAILCGEPGVAANDAVWIDGRSKSLHRLIGIQHQSLSGSLAHGVPYRCCELLHLVYPQTS
jgi:hypothetical protein